MAIVTYGYKEEDPRLRAFLKVIPQGQFRKEDSRLGKPTSFDGWGRERIVRADSVENLERSVKIAYPVIGFDHMPDTRLAPIPFRVADAKIDRFWKPSLVPAAKKDEESHPVNEEGIAMFHYQIAMMGFTNGKEQQRRHRQFIGALAMLAAVNPDAFFEVKNLLRLQASRPDMFFKAKEMPPRKNRKYLRWFTEKTLLALAAPAN